MSQTDERRALLARRLRERAAERHFALSYPQQRLWFLEQLDSGSAVYLVPLQYRIEGPVDVAALAHALTEVVRRHHVLRTVFREVGGVPRQSVVPAEPVRVEVREVSGHEEAERLAEEQARAPIPLDAGLNLRPLLLRLGAEEHRFCLTLHHIACDGWSLALLEHELSAFYRAFTTGEPADVPELAAQYPDFAAWQTTELELAEPLGYWRAKLAGIPALSGLPSDFPRPPTQTYAGAHRDCELPGVIADEVAELAKATSATPFAVLLAAFSALVHAYTGTDEVVTGSPAAGRTRPEVQHLIGFFANTVVHRLDVSGQPSFRELVERTRDESRAAMVHQDLPFERLVEELHPARDPSHNPLFQLLFSYQETGGTTGLRLPGCAVEMAPGDTATAKFDLTLSMTNAPERLSFRLEYATGLFTEDTARQIGEQFQTLLAAALADPERSIGALPVLTEVDLDRVLVDWNAPAAPIGDELVHELIAAQAALTPDAPALLGADQDPADALTYREVHERAEALAARLRGAGVGPGVPVGVYLDRSPDLVITMLAILRAGGGYLPLDPGYPRDRLAFMVADSGTPVLVSRGGLARRVADLPVTVLRLDEPDGPDGPDGRKDTEPVVARGAQQDLAYLIYTSGSTGKPKGVMISHRNVVSFFAGMDRVLGGDDPGTWLAVTSMSFDISVLELLWTLARGYRVVVRGDEPTAARQEGGAPVPASAQAKPMQFSLFYFGGDKGGDPADRYRLLVEGSKFADRNGFAAVWTPERHFHEFGGLYPNPSVTAAAIAAVTERVAVRAGSVVLPLHDPLRVAEEWSVVDNLSHGRVGLSVASGWQPTDFVLAPEAYADRKKLMMSRLEELRGLWRGESVRRRNGVDTEVDVRVFPPPVQAELPVWVTSARSPETFQLAGEAGANLLTHLLGHSVEQLSHKIALYRQAWRESGHPGDGHVTVMLHSFAGQDTETVRAVVREPLSAYIKSSFDLLSGLGQSMGREVDLRSLPEEELDALVAQAFDRFFETSGLLGTPEHCADIVDRLKLVGVDEVACLVDFGVPHGQVLDALGQLALAREISEDRRRAAAADEPVAAQLRRHGVTHLQCTPSLAEVISDDEDSRAALSGLRRLLVGGEALPGPLAARLAPLARLGTHNMYGPTEVTVWASTHQVRPGEEVLIGGPLAGVRAYVVDRYLRCAPVNVPGELLLGGDGVARGYHDRPALTAERFVPDPFSGVPGARLYRTGDLVRRRANGELEFLGRIDHQVKLHGHRIELGEIEDALRAHPDVRAAVVTVRGEEAQRHLLAYCVPVPGAEDRLDLPAVKASLARSLPDYMIPGLLVPLAELPLTPNGKIDRKRLPDPEQRRVAGYREPEGELEQRVAEIFAEVLRAERVGADDNFFDSGGNSLLAVQARSRLMPVLGERLSLVDLFRFPTVRGLVGALTGGADAALDLTGTKQAANRRVAALNNRARANRGNVR
ncbi:MupA/Atu3671 family FMN-dependent luciferase-like monooxygenase [Amycolatopsis sp. H20-H5]|uniref:MupA/Atu3671 family FMN-dependent luciferase-like monooxygenase n=1 Tax=Amycolatopsis sp. H20-H5 TaxID=3046309 RepID=UPI002DB7C17C|nr:MupA/Atu3671 family FMN-dependent luciferase-like monooxygenase [Amycolatopsis sp. H20-H5]MEC3975021.1 MupA/Atu3671 family FMN-dependent luciferase-like monooxygenase [Amycolatopsis sp. H20-H5]